MCFIGFTRLAKLSQSLPGWESSAPLVKVKPLCQEKPRSFSSSLYMKLPEQGLWSEPLLGILSEQGLGQQGATPSLSCQLIESQVAHTLSSGRSLHHLCSLSLQQQVLDKARL